MNEYKQPTPRRILTETEHDTKQLQLWLANSHYWIERDGTTICRWCKKVSTDLDADASLCNKNPVIKKLIDEFTKYNTCKDNEHHFGKWNELDREYCWLRGGIITQQRICKICNFKEIREDKF